MGNLCGLLRIGAKSVKVDPGNVKKNISSGNVATAHPRQKWYFKFYCTIGGYSSCLCVRKLLFLRIQYQRLLSFVCALWMNAAPWRLVSFGRELYRWVILRRISKLIFSRWDRKLIRCSVSHSAWWKVKHNATTLKWSTPEEDKYSV